MAFSGATGQSYDDQTSPLNCCYIHTHRHTLVCLLEDSVLLSSKMDSSSSSPSPSPPGAPPVPPDVRLYSLCDPIYSRAAAIPRLLNPWRLAERVFRETIT